jgi:hypothetical protein
VIDWLKENLKAFNLPSEAIDWLLMVYQAIQLFDDVADGDKVERKDLNDVIFNTFAGQFQNTFFLSNAHQLVPLLEVAIYKWQAADKQEKTNPTAMTFAWRAGYYDLVLMALKICHGRDFVEKNGDLAMRLYGEKFEEYMKEFPCQT